MSTTMSSNTGGANTGAGVIQSFNLGRVLITPGALAALGERAAAIPFINRHRSNDWGDLSDHDKEANDTALLDGDRILSKYHLASGEAIYIITEHDRSTTTILLPEEY